MLWPTHAPALEARSKEAAKGCDEGGKQRQRDLQKMDKNRALSHHRGKAKTAS